MIHRGLEMAVHDISRIATTSNTEMWAQRYVVVAAAAPTNIYLSFTLPNLDKFTQMQTKIIAESFSSRIELNYTLGLHTAIRDVATRI